MSHTCRIVFKIVNFSKTKCCHDYYDYFIVDCDTFMYVSFILNLEKMQHPFL